MHKGINDISLNALHHEWHKPPTLGFLDSALPEPQLFQIYTSTPPIFLLSLLTFTGGSELLLRTIW